MEKLTGGDFSFDFSPSFRVVSEYSGRDYAHVEYASVVIDTKDAVDSDGEFVQQIFVLSTAAVYYI